MSIIVLRRGPTTSGGSSTASSFTAGGDLTGTSSSQKVVSITGGITGVVPVAASNIQFANTITGSITQLSRASDISAQNLTISPQGPFATATVNTSPGNILLTIPASIGTGSRGNVQIISSGSVYASLGNGSSADTIAFGATPSTTITPFRMTGGTSTWISTRNNARTLDLSVMGFIASDSLTFGGANVAGIISSATAHTLQGTTATAFAVFSSGSAQVQGALQGITATTPLSLASTVVSLTGSTLILPTASYVAPNVVLNGTLGSNATVVFPNVVGYYLVDMSGMTMGANTITFQAGSATAAALAAADVTTKRQVFTVVTRGANTIAIG